jgi:outer membrane immunogenic protein
MGQGLVVTFAAVTSLLTFPAQAADMPIKAPPGAAVTTSWAGFYIGAHAGYGYAVTATTAPDINLNSRIIGIGSKGFVAGGLAGYNVMLSPRWVGGIEVDGSWQNIKTRSNPFGPGTSADMSLDWSASVRGRLGYLMTPTTMVFASAGWSWSRVKWSDDLVPESASQSVNGPQVGFGTETMYGANWIIRTEYLHSFYDRAAFNSDVAGQFTLSPWVGVIRSALIYKPGSTAAAAWPDRAPNPIWSGFYVGGMVGPLMASGKVNVPSNGVSVDGAGVSAVLPTVLAGYNVLVAPRWLVGLEGEIAPNISTSDVKIEWTGSAQVRAGYLVTPAVLTYGSLVWGTAGIGNITHTGISLPIPVERVYAWGWSTGLEAAVTDRWRLRADYRRFFTDTVDLTVPSGGVATPTTVKASGHIARLGAIYQLTGP